MQTDTCTAAGSHHSRPGFDKGLNIPFFNGLLKHFFRRRVDHQACVWSSFFAFQDPGCVFKIGQLSTRTGSDKHLIDGNPFDFSDGLYIIHIRRCCNQWRQFFEVESVFRFKLKIGIGLIYPKCIIGSCLYIIDGFLIRMYIGCLCPHLNRHIAQNHPFFQAHGFYDRT